MPNTAAHTATKKKGTTSVPTMNWRNVRPREIRARNRPTNGAHATHHAQKNSVHWLIHSRVAAGSDDPRPSKDPA